MGNKNILFFTVHKAASMFVHNICSELTTINGMHYYSVNHDPNDKYYFNFRRSDLTDPNLWKNKKGCFAPIRWFVNIPNSDKFSIILHLRDPRDVLTSMYFSICYSHPIIKDVFEPSDQRRQEWIEAGIDEFIFQKQENNKSDAEIFLERYEEYCQHLLNKPGVIFVKYEELVTDFQVWLNKVIIPFNIPGEREVIEMLVEKYKNDFNAAKEDKFKHKRKITPGDFKEKLKPETIEHLNEMFKNILIQLDYEI